MGVMHCWPIIIFVCINEYLAWDVEVIPERPVIEYWDKSYATTVKAAVRRERRNGPHKVDLEFDLLQPVGNNVSMTLQILEYHSSGYQPTFMKMSMKLCDFFYKEQYVGQMLAKQFPSGWSCPFQKGNYSLCNVEILSKSYPFLPFSSPSINIKARADFELSKTDTKIAIFKFKLDVTVIVKPTKRHKS